MKKLVCRMCLAVVAAALALPAMAHRNPIVQPLSYSLPFQQQRAILPSTTFRSTGSAMMRSGSAYSSHPTLNSNGIASSPSPAPYGPRRIGGGLIGGGGNTNPDSKNEDNRPNGTPLGDALLPLMLMAAAFGGVVYLRRRKKA